MDHSLQINLSFEIDAAPERVWKCLTDPSEIKRWLFGTEAISEWKVGALLVFQGEYEGQTYRDHGTIHEFEPPRRFRYDYWSNWSGLPDQPENYSDILFELEPHGEGTRLKLQHKGYADEQRREHSIGSWTACMDQVKEICEG